MQTFTSGRLRDRVLARLGNGEKPSRIAAIEGTDEPYVVSLMPGGKGDAPHRVGMTPSLGIPRVPRGSGSEIGDEKRGQIRSAVSSGTTRRAAAAQHGVSLAFVQKLCADLPSNAVVVDADLSRRIYDAINERGLSHRAAAEEFGVSASSVARYLRKATGEATPGATKISKARAERIRSMVASGRSREQVATETGIPLATVATIVSRKHRPITEAQRQAARFGVARGLGRKSVAAILDLPRESVARICSDLAPIGTKGIPAGSARRLGIELRMKEIAEGRDD